MISPAFKGILATQWHWCRLGLVPVAIAGFAVPILSIQLFDVPDATGARAQFLVGQLSQWASAYPLIAGSAGLLLGTSAWSADHRGSHVYALSLPVARWKFTAFRAAAGLVLLTFPVVFLGVGATMAVITADIPITLRGYPLALTFRFAMAAMMSYALFFAVSTATPRTAALILGAAALMGLLQLFGALFGLDVNLFEPIVGGLTSWPGPFEVFGGRWLIIDF
jgi:hypothetical protein